MKLNIGVMGSSGGDPGAEVRRKAYRLREASGDYHASFVEQVFRKR